MRKYSFFIMFANFLDAKILDLLFSDIEFLGSSPVGQPFFSSVQHLDIYCYVLRIYPFYPAIARLVVPTTAPPHSSSHCGRSRVQWLQVKSKPSVNSWVMENRHRNGFEKWLATAVQAANDPSWAPSGEAWLPSETLRQHVGWVLAKVHPITEYHRRLKIWIAAASIHTSTAGP